ncbi:MAG TPA: response regulator [Roseiflexaceae bacterium]|nr:response regulator [Roseiflexaceae bacterium]
MPPPYHIIVADDDAGIRALIARVVAGTYPGVVISEAVDGDEALRIYSQYGADLLITNNAMPHLSGEDLVKTLRARHVTIPIVMVSALPSQAADALAAGVTRFLHKPFMLTELVQVLTSLLPA